MMGVTLCESKGEVGDEAADAAVAAIDTACGKRERTLSVHPFNTFVADRGKCA